MFFSNQCFNSPICPNWGKCFVFFVMCQMICLWACASYQRLQVKNEQHIEAGLFTLRVSVQPCFDAFTDSKSETHLLLLYLSIFTVQGSRFVSCCECT